MALLFTDNRKPIAHLVGKLDRLRQARVDPISNRQPVDHHIHSNTLGQLGQVFEIDCRIVYAQADKAFRSQVVQHTLRNTLTGSDDRSQDRKPGPLWEPQRLLHDLGGRVRPQSLAALRAVHLAEGCKQNPQVVCDLRQGADGGAGVPRRRPLPYRDRRAEPLDHIDVRTWKLGQDSPRMSA